MRRSLDVFLGALAVVVAVAVATRRTPDPESATSPTPDEAGDDLHARAGSPGSLTARLGLPRAVATGAGAAKALLDSVLNRIKQHGTVMVAAGLSYYALLAIFPAGIAAVSIYGLVADPVTLQNQITELSSALPEDTARFVTTQLTGIVESSTSSLGIATALSIATALWSASAGTKALVSGVNHAYGCPETRSFLVIRGASLAVTLGIIALGVSATAAVGFLPPILDALGLGGAASAAISVSRWPVVLFLVVLGLGGLYKLAPNRSRHMTRWVSPGAVLAAAAWVLATFGLSFGVNNFGDFGATYGTLAGLVVLMLWFFLSGLIVLVGAEVNSELEHQRGVA